MKKIVLNYCFGGFGLSKEAYEFMGLEWDGFGFFEGSREDENLVRCVEELGSKANSWGSNLVVEEYDDEYSEAEITEYDGYESLILHPIVNRYDIEGKDIDKILLY